jgi:hypothetical protein
MKVGSQFHAPAALGPGKNSGTHGTGGWEGSRACLDVSEKTKIILLSSGSPGL